MNTELNTNLTTVYGTVMGCANSNLLRKISETVKKFTTTRGCLFEESQSFIFNSVKYHLALEHCSQVTDLCYGQDFCINPKYSVIRHFKTLQEDESSGPQAFVIAVIIIFVILGIIITILSFAGIKYN